MRTRAGEPPRLVLLLSENWTMAHPRDLRGLVRMAQEAEAAGIDGVMLSEHIALGPSAGADGRPDNPRDWAAPRNQDPATPWPDSLVLMSAIAAATTRLRLMAAAIIVPLRHPLLLAHQLATLDLLSEGRLVVQPTVGWNRDEYAAMAVDFRTRGALLDEHLAAWRALWTDTPAHFAGRHYRFADVYLVPKPYRAEGPTLWFGGQAVSPWMVRRIVDHGAGFHPLFTPSAAEMAPLADAMRTAGRDFDELEVVNRIRGRYPADDAVADLQEAADTIPALLEQGYTTIVFKPSEYTDDPADVGRLCRELVSYAS